MTLIGKAKVIHTTDKLTATHKHELAAVDGFLYHVNYEGKSSKSMYCSQRSERGCEGAIKLWKQSGRVSILHDHNHDANQNKVEASKLKVGLKAFLTTLTERRFEELAPEMVFCLFPKMTVIITRFL